MIKKKYISVQKHPTEDLYIYNYTPKCQYNKMWNEETLSCRGLILDGEGKVVARPFKKFFNIEEVGDKIPNTNFKVYEKYDGSLGILYWINDEPNIATRGSFTSDQAIKGTEMIRKYDYSKLNRNYTYLFEIIYPENKIVVDYGKEEKLILLAIIETSTGKELPLESTIFETARLYVGFSLDTINLIRKSNKTDEGFVLKWEDGYRLKMKNEEYVRLHKLITNVTARSIWDLLQTGSSVEELLDRVPDEFYYWVESTIKNLKGEYEFIRTRAIITAFFARKYTTRKEQALFIIKNQPNISEIVFAMLDKKEFSTLIWEKIKPRHKVPFKEEIW